MFVGQVRYRYRGWNGVDADPVADVRQALDELADLVGEVPVVLVGHSMGGRAPCAPRPRLRSGPWWPSRPGARRVSRWPTSGANA